MATAPSLALRSLLTSVLRDTGLQSPLQRISGATAPVRALVIATAAKRLSDGVVLFVVPTDAEIDTSCADISFFLSVLEGSAGTVVERQVLPFPSTQVDPYRGFQPHLKVASARARVLHALASGRCSCRQLWNDEVRHHRAYVWQLSGSYRKREWDERKVK